MGAKRHSPVYAEVDHHHIYPKYLAALLGLPERPETVDLCAGCHDDLHHVLRHWINEGHPGGHHLPQLMRWYVQVAWAWWQDGLLT